MSNRLRIVREFTFEVPVLPSVVFPLLCPVREYDWIDGWQCEMVYSDSGVAEDRCVFITRFPNEPELVWMCVRFEPAAGKLRYVVTGPGSHVETLDIEVDEVEGGSRLNWRRTYTALTEDGEKWMREWTGAPLDEEQRLLARALDHYCRTGDRLPLQLGPGQ
jgi:hypothetical protein